MTHLSPEELLDVAEGTAAEARAAHADSCESCRAQVAALRDTLRLAKSVPGLDPLPLFWDRLAARIGNAARRERQGRTWWRSPGWQLAPLGAAAALVIAIGVGVRLWPAPAGRVTVAPGAPAADQAKAVGDAQEDVELSDDASWALVSELSPDVAFDEAETLGELPASGTADRALMQLDESEQIELARILREELARPVPGARKGPGA